MATKTAQQLVLRQKLELELYHADTRRQALRDQLPQCRAALRQAKITAVEYEAPGLRGFLDKLAGTREEKLETLRRQVRGAQAELDALERDLAVADGAWEQLQALGDTLECAQTLDPEERELILGLEAGLAARKLLPALERNYAALEEAQQWARPNNRVEAVPGYNQNVLLSEADGLARECMALLERIAQCGILLEIHPYFTNPAGYISGVTRFNQLDRIYHALGAILDTQKQLRELLTRLPQIPQWEETV